MSTFNESNVRRGVTVPGTTAGSFAEHRRSTPEVSLTRQWGESGAREGMNTPWGAADTVENVAPGIDFVGTPSHGGYRLSKERQALIPRPYRRTWYEEDCEWAFVATTFPDEFRRGDRDPEDIRAEAERVVKDYFPDAWEKVNGRELQPGESRAKDEKSFEERNAANFVSTSAISSEAFPDMVRVTAVRREDNTREEFLVPRDEYRAAGQQNFVIDPSRHPKLPPAPAEPKVERGRPAPEDKVSAIGLVRAREEGKLTPAAVERVAKDLGKLWREKDGSVVSLRDIVTRDNVALTAYAENGKMKYSVAQYIPGESGHYSFAVSKATFDYLNEVGVPDDRSEAQRAQQEASIAQYKAEKLRAGGDMRVFRDPVEREKAQKATAEAERLRARADELRAAEQAADIAANGTWEERAARQKEAIAEREREARIDETA